MQKTTNLRILEISCEREIGTKELAELLDMSPQAGSTYRIKKAIKEAQAKAGVRCARQSNLNTDFTFKYLGINEKDIIQKIERNKQVEKFKDAG